MIKVVGFGINFSNCLKNGIVQGSFCLWDSTLRPMVGAFSEVDRTYFMVLHAIKIMELDLDFII